MPMDGRKAIIILSLIFFMMQGCAHEQILPSTVVNETSCRFTYKNSTANAVNLAGSFNNWDPSSLPMSKIDKNTWSVTINLAPGVYYYQFVINGKTWVVPPYAQAYAEDGFGGKNGVVIISK
ncbi:MAG: isoamylase early set domain-containing protein [bacterium]